MTTAASKLTTFRRSLAAAGAVAALAVTSVTFAAPVSDAVPSVTVRFDDLNLDSPAGADTLYHRISSAARAVCRDENTRDLTMLAAFEHSSQQEGRLRRRGAAGRRDEFSASDCSAVFDAVATRPRWSSTSLNSTLRPRTVHLRGAP